MALIRQDSGCKVGWETYDDKAEAEARSVTARAQAIEMASRGYDFGYQSPGEVMQVRSYPHKTEQGTVDYGRPEYVEEWTVTIP